MKIKRERVNKAGNRELVVELSEGETLLAIHKRAFYKLADPVDDIVAHHVLHNMKQVFWCSATQQWVE